MITSAPPCFTPAAQNLYPLETILVKLLQHLLSLIEYQKYFFGRKFSEDHNSLQDTKKTTFCLGTFIKKNLSNRLTASNQIKIGV